MIIFIFIFLFFLDSICSWSPLACHKIRVALTRDSGSNEDLKILLNSNADFQNKVDLVEIPCIQFTQNQEASCLIQKDIAQKSFDLVVITSPQSAKFVCGFTLAPDACPHFAAVGKGTESALKLGGISPVFVSSDFSAKSFSSELPQCWGKRILYPASSLADDTLATGLCERGFQVRFPFLSNIILYCGV